VEIRKRVKDGKSRRRGEAAVEKCGVGKEKTRQEGSG
jgi:hypothetical protein